MQNKSAYVWALVGRLLPQVLYLLTTMVLARFLTPEDFGIIGILSIFFLVANTLLDSGLGGSLINEPIITEVDCSTIFTFNIGVSVMLYAMMFLLAPWIENYYESDGLTMVIRVICLMFIIQAFALVPTSLLIKHIRFQVITQIRTIAVILASITSIVMAWYGVGVYSLVAYQLVQAAAIAVLVHVKSPSHVSFAFDVNSFKRLFPFGMFTTLSNVVDTIYENMLAAIYGKALNIEQAGFLNQSKRIEEVASQSITQTINSASFPILVKLKSNREAFIREAASIFKSFSLIILPVMLLVSIYSTPVVILLFGSQWEPAGNYLAILCIAGVFIIIENLNRNFIKSLGEVSVLFKITLIKRAIGILLIFCCLFVNVRFVLYGYVVSSFMAYLINQFTYCRLVNISFLKELYGLLKMIIVLGVFYFALLFIRHTMPSLVMQIIITAIMVSVYYVCVLWKVGYLNSKRF